MKKSNEPETHLFLQRILSQLKCVHFIDVGASVGEFVFGVSNYLSVQQIFASEPRLDCARVLKIDALLNNKQRLTVFANAVSNLVELIPLYLNAGGTSSGFYNGHNNGNNTSIVNLKTLLLDDVLLKILVNTIMLIDVECAEPLVLIGVKVFIEKNQPLIVFE